MRRKKKKTTTLTTIQRTGQPMFESHFRSSELSSASTLTVFPSSAPAGTNRLLISSSLASSLSSVLNIEKPFTPKLERGPDDLAAANKSSSSLSSVWSSFPSALANRSTSSVISSCVFLFPVAVSSSYVKCNKNYS